jgi:hypothetical protein
MGFLPGKQTNWADPLVCVCAQLCQLATLRYFGGIMAQLLVETINKDKQAKVRINFMIIS